MRNLCKIIQSAKNNEQPEYEELFYAVLALSSLWHFDKQALWNINDKISNTVIDVVQNESFNRAHDALNRSPKEFIDGYFD